jgi:hypothetical protein
MPIPEKTAPAQGRPSDPLESWFNTKWAGTMILASGVVRRDVATSHGC